MIRLNGNNKEDFIGFVAKNPTLNLFYMGDYLEYGFENPICEYFGIYRNGDLEVCVMAFSDSIHVSGNYVDDNESQQIYDLYQTKKAKKFNTSKNFMNLIENFPFTVKLDMCELSVYQGEPRDLSYPGVKMMKIEDSDEFMKVRSMVFSEVTNKENFIAEHERGATKSYVRKVDGKIVSIATVTAFTPDAGMIVGVGTLEEYRQQGYARQCMEMLCNDLIKEGKKAVLFYTDPKAGALYHSIGFVDQEPYYILSALKVVE